MNFDDTARYFGPSEKLWPELFIAPGKAATMLCRECRKVVVEGKRRYCGKCAHRRKLESDRQSQRAKRQSNVRKLENSPVRAEALTHAKIEARCSDTTVASMSLEGQAQ